MNNKDIILNVLKDKTNLTEGMAFGLAGVLFAKRIANMLTKKKKKKTEKDEEKQDEVQNNN